MKRFKKKVNEILFAHIQLSDSSKQTFHQKLHLHTKSTKYCRPVPRCYRCQRHSHIEENCKGNVRCVRCGGDHFFIHCENKDNPKCCHCKENHLAVYRAVDQRYKEAVKIHMLQKNPKTSTQRRRTDGIQ